MQSTVILLPVYCKDSTEYLEKAIQSCLNQTYKDLELHILIDGPIGPDLNRRIDACRKYKRTVVHRYKENGGLAHTLNCALEEIPGGSVRYIVRMDSDDIMVRTRLESQIGYLEAHPDVDAVGSAAIVIDELGNETGVKKVKSVITLKDLRWSSPLIHPSMAFRSDFFRKVGLYDPALLKSQDYDLWFRALRKGMVIHNIQESLLYFRSSGDTITRRKKEQLYNIRIKRQYLKGVVLLLSIIYNFMILIFPGGLMGRFVNRLIYKKLAL